jgi:dihydrodipicolinate synthase/N-acetylneuraminate lyase
MIFSRELGGLLAMMPAFGTDEAANVNATMTISVERMQNGLNRMIEDGADVIATTGSFGECHTLTSDEFATLAVEAARIVNGRIPLFIGVTSLNTRDVVAKMRIVEKTKATGVLVGVPFYFPSSPENAERFYRDIAAMFPSLAIMVYHNPLLHNIKLTVPIIRDIMNIPGVVAMKDSHRDPAEFMRLMDVTKDKLTVFVNQLQYATYAPLGARGFWSIDAWMGPWPQLALRDAVEKNDLGRAVEISLDLSPPAGAQPNMQWRENGQKIAIRYAGYVDPGPLRPPFLEIPPAIDQAQRQKAERWKMLTAKYQPLIRT